ncbi:MAG: rod shape-determining protein MreC [Bacillales bacterium]|nr:rod shape-determining protein MreC [Bacillales bacterium]
MRNFFQSVSDLRTAYEENKYLKSKIENYAELSVKINELQNENDELKAILKKTDDLKDVSIVQSSIIARSPDQWHDVIFINKGKQHGIKENMAVITPKGLIGKIKIVSEFTSSVQLLTSPERTNRISATISGKKAFHGLIEGYDEDKKALLLKKIPADYKVIKKQKVITSGLGGVFPKGLIIGEVIEAKPDDYGLTQTVFVKPLADFYDINNIMVIERTMPSPSNDILSNDGGLE